MHRFPLASREVPFENMTSVDGSIMSLAPGEMMISPATLCVPDHTSTALMYPELVSLSAATGAAGPIKAESDEIRSMRTIARLLEAARSCMPPLLAYMDIRRSVPSLS